MEKTAMMGLLKLETAVTLQCAGVDAPLSECFPERAQGSTYSYVFVLETWMFARICSLGTGLIVVQNLMI